jgi:hypothetical protein
MHDMRERLRKVVQVLFPAGSMVRAVAVVLLAIVAATVVAAAARDRGNKNAYVLQAEAFLRGTLEVPDENLLDVAYYRGHVYVPLPPFPAVVLTPFVALFGRRLPPTVVGILLALLTLALLSRVLRRAEIEDRDRWWIVAGFFLGTGYWWCLLKTWEMWCFAQLVATAMMVLAIHQAYVARRATTAGLAWGAAVLSRQLCIWTAPFLIAALWQESGGSRRVGQAFRFVIAGGVLLALYLAMNWARFDSPFNTGYGYIHHMDFLADRARQYGLFHPAYLPHNFAFMFLQGFHIEFAGPLKLAPREMDPFGTSLTMASPFLATAFLARNGSGMVRAAWISLLPMLASALLYYNNGWVQVNCQRFTLDLMPVLIWLQARGAKAVNGPLWKAGVAWAVGLNVLAIVGMRIAYGLFSRLGFP